MDQEPKNSEEPQSPVNSTPINSMPSMGMAQPTNSQQIKDELPTAESMRTFDTEPAPEGTKTVSIMTKVQHKGGAGKTILIIVLIVLLVAAGVAAYWWRDKTANDSAKTQTTTINGLNAQITTLKAKLAVATGTTTPTGTGTTTCVEPTAAAIASIKNSITSANTAGLEGYMAASVNTILTSSGSPVSSTPVQAVSTITDFITSAKAPWNFAVSSSVMSGFSAGAYGKYFPTTAIVGESSDSKVISFNFDCTGLIDAVLLSPSEDLLE
jgi:uncharacterized protein (UPF0333 family)